MIVGIDLGTTNSLISYYDGEKAIVIPNRLGDKLTPSVVSLDEDGTVCIGKTAHEIGIVHPERSAAVFKRSMGLPKKYMLGDRAFTSEELSSLLLRSLKEDAECFLGCEVKEAVISVPAYFNDAQRKATKKAGELAGFQVERIISEPTAAAIAYGMHLTAADEKILVFDLGGGTFDVSVLEVFEKILEVRAVAGDNFLGGEDFTDVLLRMFLNQNDVDEGSLTDKELSRLKDIAEEKKKQFSENDRIVFEATIGKKSYRTEISLDNYERSCQMLLMKIRKPIEKSLKDAGISLKEIGEVLLVGGSTKLPVVRSFAAKLFGRMPNAAIDPDQVVAEGASVAAAMKERNESVKELILTDVCPYTLGTEVCITKAGGYKEPGHYLPIIERNTTIPVSRTHRVYTASDNQTALKVEVLQGESRYTMNNVLLGELEIPVPPGPSGKEAADITFTYDVNSILEVIVKVVSTGKEHRMIIKNEATDLTDAEIDARLEELAELKILPRDQEENKLLMARGDRLYEEATGDYRKLIEHVLEEFETAMDKQDRTVIETARKKAKEQLDEIEMTMSEE